MWWWFVVLPKRFTTVFFLTTCFGIWERNCVYQGRGTNISADTLVWNIQIPSSVLTCGTCSPRTVPYGSCMSDSLWWSLLRAVIDLFYYHPQTKFVKVMFSQVSVCPQGGCLSHCMLGYTPGTRGRHPLPPGQTPPAQCMLGYTHTHTHMRSACWDTVNKRALRIPLECILVIDGMAHLVHLTLFYIQFLKEWIQIPIPLLHLAVGIGIWIRRCIVGKVLNITI